MKDETYTLTPNGWLMLKLDLDFDAIDRFWCEFEATIVNNAQLHGFTEGVPVLIFDPDQGPICQLVPQVEKEER